MPKRARFSRREFLSTTGGAVAGLGLLSPRPTDAQARVLSVAYNPHPVIQTSVDAMRRVAAKMNVELDSPAIAYVDYVQSQTAQFMGPRNRYQIIWNNDDWGQLFGPFLEPLDPEVKQVWADDRVWMMKHKGRQTAAPFVLTCGCMFYRTDLISESEFPKTFDELLETCKKVQAKGVKWGIMGGSAFNHIWFTLLWSAWSNNADLFQPYGARSWEQLDKGKWTPGVTEKPFIETVEWWWDAIHTHKIAPPSIAAGATRNDTDAMFMQGDTAIAVQDTTLLGTYRDPAKSKVADKVAAAGFPVGPNNKKGRVGWFDGWFWSVPKNNPPDAKKKAKEIINALIQDKDAHREIWKKVGGVPSHLDVQKELLASDPEYRKIHAITVASPQPVHGAYYWPLWPEIHSLTAKAFTQALTGPKDKIPEVMAGLARDYKLRAPVPPR